MYICIKVQKKNNNLKLKSQQQTGTDKMENIRTISNELQIYSYHSADSKGEILEKNGTEICGVITAFYTPNPVPFWFICDPSGFRRQSTKEAVKRLYNEHLNTNTK